MVKWRVGSNSSGREVGIDSGNIEMFKRAPMESFSREIIQNSIDAKDTKEKKVLVEFKSYEIGTSKIPGINDLREGILNILRNWNDKGKTRENELNRIKEMYNIVLSDSINCLRASDFYTYGLHGINSDSETSSFYTLTKGDGISFKTGTTGGSKGIGKFASFVVSEIHTVFYFTIATDGGVGYMGTAYLPSGYYDSRNKKVKTNGEWYYANGEYNEPVKDKFFLDPNFQRENEEYGTDVYIIGFRKESNWETEIITKALDSFLVAIYKEELDVKVNETLITKNNLEEIIENLNISKRKLLYKSIKSQFDLLNDSDVIRDEIIIENMGKISLYTKIYNKENSFLATKKCTLVRYPYMKIKELSRIVNVDFSALAVINDDDINKTLRKFENPEHTDWLFNRTDYDEKDRKAASDLYNLISSKIKESIEKRVFTSDHHSSDFEGAVDFLPDVDVGDVSVHATPIKKETPIIHNKAIRKNIDGMGYDNDGESLIDGEFSLELEETQKSYPDNKNGTNGKNVDGITGDRSSGLTKSELRGVRYHLMVKDGSKGEYYIKFYYYEDLKNCNLIFKLKGDRFVSNEKHELNILKAIVNGNTVTAEKNQVKGFSIEKDKVNEIFIKTDQNELFSGEVMIYAYR